MSRWGSLVARHLTALSPALLFGCSAAPPPEPAPPLTPPPPASTPEPPAPKAPALKPDPAGATAGLSDYRALHGSTAVGTLLMNNEQLVAFGKGVVAVGTLLPPGGYSAPECLMAGGTRARCTFLRMATWARPQSTWAFYGPIQENAVGGWSGLRPAPSDWSSLSGGRDVVYAVHGSSGLNIDTINEKGEVAPLVEAPSFASELGYTRVVEVPKGLVVLGVDPNENELMLVPIKREGAKGVPGDVVKTGITMLPPGATAAWARGVVGSRKKAGFGVWAAAPALDAKGEPDNSVYIAWTEVIPPAKYTPAGVAPKKHGAKHGCGRGSRPLSDVSVEKRVHVARFSAEGKRLDDRVAASVTFPPDDEELKLSVVPTSYGYVLNGVPHDRNAQPKRDAATEARPTESLAASPPLPAPPLQKLDAAAYDQRTGQGLLLVTEDSHQIALRFDGTGDPVGEPVALEGRVQVPPLNRASLGAAGEAWGALEQNNAVVQILTGPSAGKRVAIPSDQSWVLSQGNGWVLPLDDDHIEVVRYVRLPSSLASSQGSKGEPWGPLVARVNLKNATATPWQLVANWLIEPPPPPADKAEPPGKGAPADLPKPPDDGKVPRVRSVLWAGRGADGQILFLGHNEDRKSELHALAGEAWAKPVVLGDGAPSHRANVLSVWKDHAVLFDDSNSVVSWLGKGLTVQVGRNFNQSSGPVRNNGPLLRPGEVALPGEAGEPVKVDAAVKKAFGGCPASFATGPRRLLLVCIEPPDAKTPGARVGTRVLRFLPRTRQP